MKFRLVYEGPLEAATSGNRRVDEKHAIRQQLHPQLRELWRVHPAINKNFTLPRNMREYAENFARFGFNFAPLMNKTDGLACGLDILFLRRDMPGNLIRPGGDLDNRIKTLLDALKIPSDKNQLGTATPTQDEDPFYCLLEDDSQINEISITTDRLLAPLRPSAALTDVVLILHVRTLLVIPPHKTFMVAEAARSFDVLDGPYQVD